MRRVCVFCGSSTGNAEAYARQAGELGALLARRGLGLVYGGASVGTMGVLADAALDAGGEVIGVIPRQLMEAEVGHSGVTELHVVADMHERKARMAELADGFLALPGGVGTLEELFEVWTWAQLGLHGKPLGLVDVAGYYSPLAEFAEHMVAEGFLRGPHRELLAVNADPAKLLDGFAEHTPDPRAHYKWVD